MYTIKTELLRLKLEVVPVKALLPHEKTLPGVSGRLYMEFKNWASLQSPIIIDENNIVLDGNHRASVFNDLGFNYIAVCKINYFNKNTKLKYWYRIIDNIKNIDSFKSTIRSRGGTCEMISGPVKLKKTLKQNHLSCGAQYQNYYIHICFPKKIVDDAVSAYRILQKIQDQLVAMGSNLQYIPCQKVGEDGFCQKIKQNQIVIWTPQITKEMVVEVVKKGLIFSPKTTRHLIPARPINVNVPSRWFKEDISFTEINERFYEFIKSKHMRQFGPGQIIDGRYYEEQLFVFYDEK